MKKMNKARRVGLALAFCAMGTFPALAVDPTPAETATAISTAVKGYISAAQPEVLATIVAGLIVWGVFFMIGLMKKGANVAKSK